jgi:hypothetical protein
MKTILYRGYSERWINEGSASTRDVNASALRPFDRKQPAVTVPAGLEACAWRIVSQNQDAGTITFRNNE